MRACSLSSGSGPCNSLGELYLERNNFKDALLVFDLPKCDSKYCLANASKIKQLGATTHRHDAEESLCHDEYEYGACNELSAQGEPFDFNTWIEEKKQNINEHDRADRIAERQLRIDRAERDQEKDQRHAEIAGLVQGLTDTAVSSYGNYQAGVAQARVNAETIRLSQQNKGAGGNPTTSSGGSSSNSSSSSTVSSKAAPNKSSTAATSDSSDSSSDSSASSGNCIEGRYALQRIQFDRVVATIRTPAKVCQP